MAARWCNGCCAKSRRSDAPAQLAALAALAEPTDTAGEQRRLNQRRVFILPTRQGGAFGLALLVMLLAAINYQNSLAYGLTFLLLSLGVVTILHTYRNLAGLRLTALGADPVFAGERAGFRVRLESPRRARQAIAVGWPERPLEYADLAGDAAAEVLLFHPTERRGWLRPGRLRVESRFPLGLLVAWAGSTCASRRWSTLGRRPASRSSRRARRMPRTRGARWRARASTTTRDCAPTSRATRGGACTGRRFPVARGCW